MATPTSAREEEKTRFANLIAAALEEARQRGEFEKLVLIAGPKMLGRLRQALTPACQATVDIEITRNLSKIEAEAIRTYFE